MCAGVCSALSLDVTSKAHLRVLLIPRSNRRIDLRPPLLFTPRLAVLILRDHRLRTPPRPCLVVLIHRIQLRVEPLEIVLTVLSTTLLIIVLITIAITPATLLRSAATVQFSRPHRSTPL